MSKLRLRAAKQIKLFLKDTRKDLLRFLGKDSSSPQKLVERYLSRSDVTNCSCHFNIRRLTLGTKHMQKVEPLDPVSPEDIQ